MAGGGGQGGPFVLSAQPTTRVASGDEGFHIFPVFIDNAEPRPVAVDMSVFGEAKGIGVRVPGSFEIGSRTTREVPVIVSVSTPHEHGDARKFSVGAAATGEGRGNTSIDLALAWPYVPQPAQHHSTLYLHSASEAPELGTWMNARETDPIPVADDADVGGSTQVMVNGTVRRWDFELTPTLEVGLEFVNGASTHVLIEAHSTPALPDASWQAELLRCVPGGRESGGAGCSPGSWHPLFQGGTVAAVSPTASPIDLELQPVGSVDRADFERGSNLQLAVSVQSSTNFAANTGPRILTNESMITLPLETYEDENVARLMGGGQLRLEVMGDSERVFNPGDTVVFDVTVENAAATFRNVGISLGGASVAWARSNAHSALTMAAGQSNELQIAITAPSDSVPGDRAEILVIAQDQDEPSTVVVAQLTAIVVDEAIIEVDDEAQRFTERPDSDADGTTPGPSPLLALGAVLAVLASVRRGMGRSGHPSRKQDAPP